MEPASIVAHRTLWSLAILILILAWRREGKGLLRELRNIRTVGWLTLSGLLLAANWLLYVWATLNGKILEGALGYYLNPFFNMLFGFLWFGDRNNRQQLIAIALALIGTLLQIPALGGFPWLSLTLAITFALYAVVKKKTPLESRMGLTAETTLLAPIALIWLWHQSSTSHAIFGSSWQQTALLVGAGLATTTPLLLFGHAARNIRLSTLGMIQFIGPTLQFIIGWQLFKEPMTTTRLASFALIWIAIAIYAADSYHKKTPSA
jgi:chloramphenicol-sensitive protein RarD